LKFLRSSKEALAGLLMLASLLAAPLWGACTGACSDDGDCAANACHYCDTDIGFCADCCEILDEPTCPPACTWNSANFECRNEPSTPCGITVPEVPAAGRNYFFIGTLLAAFFVSAWWAHRRRRAPRA